MPIGHFQRRTSASPGAFRTSLALFVTTSIIQDNNYTEAVIVKIRTKRLFSEEAYQRSFDVGQAQGICS